MKSLRFLLLLLAWPIEAAVVTGDVRDIKNAAYSPTLRFIPLSTPLANGDTTILDIPRTTPIVNGVFSISLVGGLYSADFGPPNKPIKILVPPDDPNTYNFNHVAGLATNLGTFTFTNPIGRISSRVVPGSGITVVTNNEGMASEFIELSASAGEQPLTFSAPLARNVNTVSLPPATTLASGHLTAADFATFNSKPGFRSVNIAPSGGTATIPVNNLVETVYVTAGPFGCGGFTITTSGTAAKGQILHIQATTPLPAGCGGTVTFDASKFTNNAGPAALTFGYYENYTFATFIFDGSKFLEIGSRELRGTIKLWSGSIGSIPKGWTLCDGSHGSPDLRDRFVIGANGTYAVGATGGSATWSGNTDDSYTYLHDLGGGGEVAEGNDSRWSNEADMHSHWVYVDTMPPYYALAFIFKL